MFAHQPPQGVRDESPTDLPYGLWGLFFVNSVRAGLPGLGRRKLL
jgi:hypothetical protein